MANQTKAYTGKIGGGSAQVVKGPYVPGGAKKSKVKTGGDLRQGGGKK